MFDENDLKKLTVESWRRAVSFGANYILEMNVEPSLEYSGETCALIGLMVGSEGICLAQQNWIDDIISDELGKHPVKYLKLKDGTLYLFPEDLDALREATEEAIISNCISRGIFPNNLRDIVPQFTSVRSLDLMLKTAGSLGVLKRLAAF